MVKRVKIIVRTPHKDESSAAHIDRLISSVLFFFFSVYQVSLSRSLPVPEIQSQNEKQRESFNENLKAMEQMAETRGFWWEAAR